MSILIKNSAWALVAQGGKVVAQAGLFIILARGFGASDFGFFMAMFSIAQLIYPFSGLGTHNTMVMRVSRLPRLLPYYFWTPLFATLFIGIIAAVLFSWIVVSFYDSPQWMVLLILLTELVSYRLLDVATHAWQAKENLKKVSLAYLSISLTRVLLATVLLSTGWLSLSTWIVFNIVFTSLIAVWCLYLVIKKYDLFKCKVRVYYKDIYRSIYFSFSGSSQAINANVDKIVLSRIGTLYDVGVYSAAYRVVQMSLIPIIALFQAAYPSYFRAGRKEIRGALELSRRLALPLLAYSLFASLSIYFLSPTVPFILGEDYEGAVDLIRLLCPLPVLFALHHLLGEAMTGAGLQKERAFVQIIVGFISVLINIVLIKTFGVVGAVFAILVSEFLVFLGYFFILKMRG
ncbi:oligosaccharide flippase family protein [Vreelandella olivaria]|uniref:oligosaccharide flippase family protein n=1 Tax=Vreelandella olivaria TaxID=390919 RepID=UPI00201F4CE0|nr:oligosaccharide flippase family protein [Halomonas olivaria]